MVKIHLLTIKPLEYNILKALLLVRWNRIYLYNINRKDLFNVFKENKAS